MLWKKVSKVSEIVETIVSDQKYVLCSRLCLFSGFLLLAEKTRINATVLAFAYASTQSVLYSSDDECSGVPHVCFCLVTCRHGIWLSCCLLTGTSVVYMLCASVFLNGEWGYLWITRPVLWSSWVVKGTSLKYALVFLKVEWGYLWSTCSVLWSSWVVNGHMFGVHVLSGEWAHVWSTCAGLWSSWPQGQFGVGLDHILIMWYFSLLCPMRSLTRTTRCSLDNRQ